jgi:citrate lyase subunit beta/citryl-CoA lyase
MSAAGRRDTVAVATAGVRGPDVRSDCWVEVRPTPAGAAPARTVESRVAALYGRAIRELLESALRTLGAEDLSVTLQDSGALPFTLMARIEAAVRRMRPDAEGELLPPLDPATVYPAPRERARRTRLYLPGNTPKYFVNAGLHRPDAVILDLEDSVAEAEKDAARHLVRAALRAVPFYGAEKMVRVNRLPLGLEDVRHLAPHGVHTVLLPKAERAEEVRAVHDQIERLRREGAVSQPVHLVPIVESARGVLAAAAVAAAAPSVVALAIGLEDYTADIGARRTPDGQESAWALGQVVNAARAAGVQPLASVFGAVDDETGLRAWAGRAAALGFEGIGCLHPRQVRPVHEAFAPDATEQRRAQEIVARFAAAAGAGEGVIAVDGEMVDAPVVARARRVLARAQADADAPWA